MVDNNIGLGLGPSPQVSGSNVTSGLVGTTYGGTGLDGHLAANGSLLIGTGSGYSLATLTAGNGIAVTNGAGAITLKPKSYLIGADCAAHSLTGTLTETVLMTISVTAANYSIPANSVITVRSLWTYTNNANNKNLRIRIGAAGAGTGGTLMWQNTNTTTASAARDAVIFVRGTSSQIAAPNSLGSHEFSTTSAVATATIDLTANWEITATASLGNSADTIQLEAITVEVATP